MWRFEPKVLRSEATAMRVAKMISYTLLGMAGILGMFIFMSAYVQSRPCYCGLVSGRARRIRIEIDSNLDNSKTSRAFGDVYTTSTNHIVCFMCCSMLQAAESRDNPYYEPLTALSSDEAAKNIKRLPIRIHMDAGAGVRSEPTVHSS